MEMTKIQFDTIRRLARAYGHEWAINLDFDQKFPTMTRGDWVQYMAAPLRHCNGEEYTLTNPDELAEMELFQKWVALHARIEAGHVPTFDEIESLAVPLFESEHFPSTPWVLLKHETCTQRTRWEVCADGEARFEFRRGYDESKNCELICRAISYVLRDGRRVAMVDGFVPLDAWGDEHITRVVNALVATGCTHNEAKRAVNATAHGHKHVLRFDLAKEHAAANARFTKAEVAL